MEGRLLRKRGSSSLTSGISMDNCSGKKVKNEELDENGVPLPPEVLELVFHRLEFKFVKTCRLVSKLWNIEACRALRRGTLLSLVGNESKPSEVWKTLRSNQFKKLPFPFKNICVDNYTLLDNGRIDKFLKLYHKLDLKVTSLEFKLKAALPHEYPRCLPLYRAVNLFQSDLTHFIFDSSHPFSYNVDAVCKFSLPSLKRLDLNVNFGSYSNEINFLIALTRGSSNLSQLNIKVHLLSKQLELIKSVLQNGSFFSLEELTMRCFIALQSNAGALLEAMNLTERMPQLKKLTFVQDHPSPISQRIFDQTFKPVIPTIQFLSLDDFQSICSPSLSAYSFTALTELQLGTFDIGSSLQGLPALKTFGAAVIYITNDCDIVPHQNVARVEIQKLVSRGADEWAGSCSCAIEFCILKILQQFPSANDWKVSCQVLQIFCDYVNQFAPIVKNNYERIHFLDLGEWPDIRRQCKPDCDVLDNYFLDMGARSASDRSQGFFSVKDFKGLQAIRLGREHKLNNAFVNQCFGSLMSLKLVEFYWHEDMTADVIVNAVSHIQTVVILNCCDTEHKSETLKVFQNLPTSVFCGCRRSCPSGDPNKKGLGMGHRLSSLMSYINERLTSIENNINNLLQSFNNN